MGMSKLTSIISDPQLRANLESRLWPKIECRDVDDCWWWVAKAKHPYGYGRVSFGRKIQVKAHQAVYALVNGPIEPGKVVRHSCDNPGCCNPKHLLIGTQKDNSQDAVWRNRAVAPPTHYDVRHHNVKITEEEFYSIKVDTRSARIVAAQYGLCDMTVYRIRNGKTWMRKSR